MSEITIAQVSYDIPGAAAASGLGETTLREAIASGDLIAHYAGQKATKPIIRAVELDAWIESLPTTRRAK